MEADRKYFFCINWILVFSLHFSLHFSFWFVSKNWWVYPEISTLYMPLGIRLGLLLVLPFRYWPAILFSDVATYMVLANVGEISVDNVFLYGLTLLFKLPCLYYLSTAIIKVIFKKRIANGMLISTQGLMVFILALTANQLANAADAISWIPFDLIHSDIELYEVISTIFVGGMTGILFMSPLFLAAVELKHSGRKIEINDLIQLTFLASIVVVLAMLFYFLLPSALYTLRAVAFLPLLYACFKYGWLGGLGMSLIINSLLLASMYQADSALFIKDNLHYMFGFSFTGLFMGAAVTQQQRLNNDLLLKNKSLLTANERVQMLATKVIDIQEQEKKHLSQELHDDVGQNLVLINSELAVMQNKLNTDESDSSIKVIKEATNQVYKSLYQLLIWLRPRVIEDYGLYKTLCGDYFKMRLKPKGIEYQAAIDSAVDELNPKLTSAIFRIVQEAVTNCVKHAEASCFKVSLKLEHHLVFLNIQDDGVGFSKPVGDLLNGYSFGLNGICERVDALSGQVQFLNGTDNGVEIRVQFVIGQGE